MDKGAKVFVDKSKMGARLGFVGRETSPNLIIPIFTAFTIYFEMFLIYLKHYIL